MSIFGAMQSGVSALSANSNKMGMIADNVSNMNTVGYKHFEAHYTTLVTAANSGTQYAPGGVRSSPFQLVDSQGLLEASQNPTDIAISGNGFFVVNEAATPGPGDRYLFTRAGQFSFDDGGYLKGNGFYLMGWTTLPDGSYDVDQDGVADPANPDPTDLTRLQAIRLNNLTSTAVPTTTVSLGLNLPATAAVGDTQTMTARIFDSLGTAHNASLEWRKTVASPPTWTLSVTNITRADNGAASTSGLGFPVVVDTVTFSGNGLPSGFGPSPLSVANWTSGASPSTVSFNLGTANQANGVTQSAAPFIVSYIDQDGVGVGRFESVEIGENGLVSALFDNGSRRAVYRLPIASFPNPNALQAVSGNAWAETQDAGSHFLNEAGTAAAGSISPKSLEASTVDLAGEFTEMILTQRAFTASTKIITTADAMLEELVRIKR
ncbi:MAG: flagellar hook protein FlgE [Alphaproteobacteria bacterium]